MRFPAQLTLLCALLSLGLPLHADDPRIAPADHKVFSPNHHFFLITKVREGETQVFRADRLNTKLWEVPAYLELPSLSDDGKHIAVAYEGGNILDNTVGASDPLITFYSASGNRRVITVGAVLPNLAALRHSTSGRPWGYVLGFQATGRLLVILKGGETLAIDP